MNAHGDGLDGNSGKQRDLRGAKASKPKGQSENCFMQDVAKSNRLLIKQVYITAVDKTFRPCMRGLHNVKGL